MTKYVDIPNIKIQELNESDISKTSSLLVDAFSKEGITLFVHNQNKLNNDAAFKLVGEMKLKLYLKTNQKVYVAKYNNDIVGCFSWYQCLPYV